MFFDQPGPKILWTGPVPYPFCVCGSCTVCSLNGSVDDGVGVDDVAATMKSLLGIAFDLFGVFDAADAFDVFAFFVGFSAAFGSITP